MQVMNAAPSRQARITSTDMAGYQGGCPVGHRVCSELIVDGFPHAASDFGRIFVNCKHRRLPKNRRASDKHTRNPRRRSELLI